MSITDLGLNDFRTDLLKYVKANGDREAAPTKNAMRNNPQKKTAQGEHAARWGVEMLEFAEGPAGPDVGAHSCRARAAGLQASRRTTAPLRARRRLSR